MKSIKKILLLLVGLIFFVFAIHIGKEVANNIANKINKSYTNNVSKIEKSKFWYKNLYFGISIETPYKLEQQDTMIPEGYEKYIKTMKNYYSDEGEVIINSLIIDSNFKEYDVKVGLEGSVNNWINTVNGTNIKLNFVEVENGLDDIVCTGSFQFNNNISGIISGYCYWNTEGKIVAIVGLGQNTMDTKIILDRMIDSIRKVF